MRIINEKNLAYADQEKPLTLEEIQKIPYRNATRELPSAEYVLNLFIATHGEPKIQMVHDIKDENCANDAVSLKVNNFKIGERIYPQGTKAVGIQTLGNRMETMKPLQSDFYYPEHLAFNPNVSLERIDLNIPRYLASKCNQGGGKIGREVTTIFGSDDRRVFNDTSYPWGCCGRVDTPIGSGSGVMIGPRHLLTVSHVIQWNPDNTTGWIRFMPAYYNGSLPFGDAWGTLTYYKYKVSGPTIDWIEGMYDYVCVVLDRPIGNYTGWLGSKGYSDSWDGGNYWAHVGYPADLTGVNRPTYQGYLPLDGDFWELDSHESMSHSFDVWPGQSGGPFFGWWSGWPYAVAVQSAQSGSANFASGGQDMVDLIIRARSEHP